MTKEEYSAAIAPLILFPVGAVCGSILTTALWRVDILILIAVLGVAYLIACLRWFPRSTPFRRALSFGVLAGIFGTMIFIGLGWRGLLYMATFLGLAGVAAFAVRRGLKVAFEQGIKAWRSRKAPSA